MRVVTVLPPERHGQEVVFRWSVEPKSDLYRRERFVLRFPPAVDLDRVPPGTWWAVLLTVLHTHWALLRPCRVVLPVRLTAGETEAWLRLTDAAVTTLEYYRRTADTRRAVEIVSSGRWWADGPAAADTGRCAGAFSGGKDSLLQAGLLAELTARPVLVAVTSPMPPLHDHTTARRRQVLAAVAGRPDVQLVEVASDLRAGWDNEFARRLGYPVSVNELTDTLLYVAATLAAGLGCGATRAFLASEAEVQETADHAGAVVQHPHFMYSLATLRAVDGLVRPVGGRVGSLAPPLHSGQVQELLWTRYRGLRGLQYSCWRVSPDEAACSGCRQCFRIAAGVLALGDRPRLAGIDLVKLLPEMEGFEPAAAGPAATPQEGTAAGLHAAIVRDVRAVSPARVAWAVLRDRPAALLSRDGWRAVAAYRRLRARLAAARTGPKPGYRTEFLRFVDPLLRDRVGAIYADRFAAADPTSYAHTLARSDRLARHLLAPLDGRFGAAAA